jgi:twitching motility protein PilT
MSEMRTPEVIRLTLNAAETGHLVLATMHSASCAEALSRICMSFPAEIQGNIRAQLADALVGVVCQRLDFLPAHHLRVPRCEVLLASSGARGTLRAGQFSHIPNVILAGGEEGMWTFDRYQRWMEQKTDWVRPAGLRPSPADETAKVISVPKAAPTRSPPPTAGSDAQRTAAEQEPEMTIDEEMDLDEIAELARKIEERTR